MDTPSSIPIASLREKSAKLRADAASMIQAADEIEAHVDALLRLIQIHDAAPKFGFAKLSAVVPVAFANQSSVFPESRIVHAEGAGKSSRYGIVTGKWLRVLRVLAEMAERSPFNLSIAGDVVAEVQGKERRAAEIRRQFDPYIEAGYMVRVDDDNYQFTDKGFQKVGLEPGNLSVEPQTPTKNEASAADATDASETALDALDRRPLE